MPLIDLENTNGRTVMLQALLNTFVTARAVATDNTTFFDYTLNPAGPDFEITGNPAVIQLASGKKWEFNITTAPHTIDEFRLLNSGGNTVVTIDPQTTYEYTQTGVLEVTGITINLGDEVA